MSKEEFEAALRKLRDDMEPLTDYMQENGTPLGEDFLEVDEPDAFKACMARYGSRDNHQRIGRLRMNDNGPVTRIEYQYLNNRVVALERWRDRELARPRLTAPWWARLLWAASFVGGSAVLLLAGWQAAEWFS